MLKQSTLHYPDVALVDGVHDDVLVRVNIDTKRTIRRQYKRRLLLLNGAQKFVDPALDFAPVPDDLWLLDANLSIKIPVRKSVVPVQVDMRNTTNEMYRENTSLIRYYADEVGRDIRFTVGLDF